MNEKIKTKHHGSAKRPHRMELTFSDQEWKKLADLTTAAGEKSLSKFARKAILNSSIIEASVTAEDRREIGKLARIGVNLWNIRRQLYNVGIDEDILKQLQLFFDEFTEIIRYYREKIQKK